MSICFILLQAAARRRAPLGMGLSRAPQAIGLVRVPPERRAYAVSSAPVPTSARSDLRASDPNGYSAQTPNANPDRISDAASVLERLGVLPRRMDRQVPVPGAHRRNKREKQPAQRQEQRPRIASCQLSQLKRRMGYRSVSPLHGMHATSEMRGRLCQFLGRVGWFLLPAWPR